MSLTAADENPEVQAKIQSISHTLSDQSSATNKQLSKAESLRNRSHCSPGHEIQRTQR